MEILNIGRYGDIINLLPVMWELDRIGKRGTLIVGQEFADVLDGVSYCDKLLFNGECHELARAIRAVPDGTKVAQVFQNPDASIKTNSFAKESWRHIHPAWLGKYGGLPTVFDQRDKGRERVLAERHINRSTIAVAGAGISSPLTIAGDIKNALQEEFQDHAILDLSDVKAEKIFDLIGALDRCECLVSIDTVHLWLARAAKCPVVGIHNDGWWGSSIGPTEVASYRYKNLSIAAAVDSVAQVVGRKISDSIMVVDKFGDEPRHKEARKSWEPDMLIYRNGWGRDAREVGDNLPLPFMRDLLQAGLDEASCADDVIIWTNDDCAIKPWDLMLIQEHASRFGATSARRDPSHSGRDMFAFRADWLRDHLPTMPDVILSAPYGDIAIARYIRESKGCAAGYDTIANDIFPCDMSPGIVRHIDHGESAWNNRKLSPSANWNKWQFENRNGED